MYLDSEKKKEIFEKYGKSNTDTGSPEAQIALFSYRIAHLTEHLKSNNFSLRSNKKAIREIRIAFLLPHIDGKPYSRLSQSFVGISAQ